MLSHKVQFGSKKIGNITNYLTQSNDINTWKSNKYYWVGGGQGFNSSVGNTDSGSFQINNNFIDPGSYYFLATWESQDGTEFAYDFSDAPFSVSQSGKVIIPLPNVAPAITPLPPISVNPSNTGDTTPRVMFWYGKVNQHIDPQGTWQTDADGTSGANLDKLTYCKKYFPNTTSVEDYKIESIGTWKDAGNVQNSYNPASYYFTSKMSTKCVQGSVVVTPATINVSMSSSTPSAQTVFAGQSGVTLAKFNLTASANVTLKSFAVSLLPLPNGYKNISSLSLYNTGAQVGTTITNPTTAGLNFQNLNLQILAGQSVTFEVKSNISSVATAGSTVYATFGGSYAVDSNGNTAGNNAATAGAMIAGNVVTIGSGVPVGTNSY